MAERYVSNPNAEVEYTKKHIAAISSVPGGVQYSHEFAISPEERERKVPHVQVPVVQPPEPLSSTGSSTPITLNIKSLKPPLSFTLQCTPTASISELKAQLYGSSSSQGAPEPERQRWLFKGKAMADERLLKEYDTIKDGDTVHLSIKAATPGAATLAPQSTTDPTTATASSSSAVMDTDAPVLAAAPTTKTPSLAPKQSPDTLATPFNFGSHSMGPPRERTSSSGSASRAHARVPSITLTTDFSNFDNLAGNGGNSPDVNFSPAKTPATPTSPPVSSVAGVQPSVDSPSGYSTPHSQPGTPMSGHPLSHRKKSPSISVPIDLDNIEMMNPLSTDRTYPVGLSAGFLKSIKDPQLWTEILEFLDNKFINLPSTPRPRSSSQSSRPASPSSPAIQPQSESMLLDDGDYKEETKRVFEAWLGASKDWMNASDIARIRDSTGVWGMAGR